MDRAIIGVLIIAGGVWWFTAEEVQAPVVDTSTVPAGDTTTPVGPADTTPADAAPAAGTFTMTVVASHNSAASCWSVVDGNVYDLTNWIGQHPGGEAAIKGLCGKDGTTAFHGHHGDAKKQADILVTMKIGVLVQ